MKNKIILSMLSILVVVIIAMLTLSYPEGTEELIDNQPNEDTEPKEDYFKYAIQDYIQSEWPNGIRFSVSSYRQWAPGGDGLYIVENTFKDKATKKNHRYQARIGTLIDGPKLFYLSVDGKTTYWDEEGEDDFLK